MLFVGSNPPNDGAARREEYFRTVTHEFGRLLNRLASGYEADPEKRHDLCQEIQLQLWKSLEAFDGRCSLKTWTLRVAHNTAASYVARESRWRTRYVSLEELDTGAYDAGTEGNGAALERQIALDHLYRLIRELKPLDRQVMLSWLEDMDAATIAEVTGLSAANVAMKVHRIRNVLMRRSQPTQVQQHA